MQIDKWVMRDLSRHEFIWHNSTPVFFTLITFVWVFWNNFYYFKSTQETYPTVYYHPLFCSSKYLNTLARLIYQSKTFQHGLIRPTDFISCLNIFSEISEYLVLLFNRLSIKSNNATKLLVLLDDDGTNSCIKHPDATQYPTWKCRALTIYNNSNTNIISKATIILFLKWIITVPLPEASLILHPNAKQKLTTASGALASARIFPSTMITIPKITLIKIVTVITIILVLMLKTTMITIWMAINQYLHSHSFR